MVNNGGEDRDPSELLMNAGDVERLPGPNSVDRDAAPAVDASVAEVVAWHYGDGMPTELDDHVTLREALARIARHEGHDVTGLFERTPDWPLSAERAKALFPWTTPLEIHCSARDEGEAPMVAASSLIAKLAAGKLRAAIVRRDRTIETIPSDAWRSDPGVLRTYTHSNGTLRRLEGERLGNVLLRAGLLTASWHSEDAEGDAQKEAMVEAWPIVIERDGLPSDENTQWPDRAEIERTVTEFRDAFGRFAEEHERRGLVLPGEATATTHCTLRGAVRQAGRAMFGERWSEHAFKGMRCFPATAEDVDTRTERTREAARWSEEDLHDPVGECQIALGSGSGSGEDWDRALAAARFIIDALRRGMAHEIVCVSSNQGRTASRPKLIPSPQLWEASADAARTLRDRHYFAPGFTRTWFGIESSLRAPWMPLVSRADLARRLVNAGYHASEAPPVGSRARESVTRAATAADWAHAGKAYGDAARSFGGAVVAFATGFGETLNGGPLRERTAAAPRTGKGSTSQLRGDEAKTGVRANREGRGGRKATVESRTLRAAFDAMVARGADPGSGEDAADAVNVEAAKRAEAGEGPSVTWTPELRGRIAGYLKPSGHWRRRQ